MKRMALHEEILLFGEKVHDQGGSERNPRIENALPPAVHCYADGLSQQCSQVGQGGYEGDEEICFIYHEMNHLLFGQSPKHQLAVSNPYISDNEDK